MGEFVGLSVGWSVCGLVGGWWRGVEVDWGGKWAGELVSVRVGWLIGRLIGWFVIGWLSQLVCRFVG